MCRSGSAGTTSVRQGGGPLLTDKGEGWWGHARYFLRMVVNPLPFTHRPMALPLTHDVTTHSPGALSLTHHVPVMSVTYYSRGMFRGLLLTRFHIFGSPAARQLMVIVSPYLSKMFIPNFPEPAPLCPILFTLFFV